MYVYIVMIILYTLFAEGLADSATQFRHSSRRLKQKAWWQQCRLKLILAAIILVILIVISEFASVSSVQLPYSYNIILFGA